MVSSSQGAAVEVRSVTLSYPGWRGRRSAPTQSVSRTSGDARQSRGSADGERDKAGAKQDKAGHGHSEETVGSEFFTHGSPPLVRPCPDNTTVPLHSQKNFWSTRNFAPG
jgi:hypothetical protein